MAAMTVAYRTYLNHYVPAMTQFIEVIRQAPARALLGLPEAPVTAGAVAVEHWQSHLPTPGLRLASYLSSLRFLSACSEPRAVQLANEVDALITGTTHAFDAVDQWQRWLVTYRDVDLTRKLGSSGAKALRRLLQNPVTVFSTALTVAQDEDTLSETTMTDPDAAARNRAPHLQLLDGVFGVRKVYRAAPAELTSHNLSIRLTLLRDLLLITVPLTPTERPTLAAPAWRLATAHISLAKVGLQLGPQGCDLELMINGVIAARLAAPAPVAERWLRLYHELAPLPVIPSSPPSVARKFAALFRNRRHNGSVTPVPRPTWYQRALPGTAGRSYIVVGGTASAPATPVHDSKFESSACTYTLTSDATAHAPQTPSVRAATKPHRSSLRLRDVGFWQNRSMPPWPVALVPHTAAPILNSTSASA
ncbi:hypothetical protein IWQ60_012014 [Tieghemiomyces parasiticus]|uniref:Uncharacterized protein n=1 Tax=Tieghemiomyces parasiticus TaxID=78921 RepID=A0A9W7ZG28_9FUNG|nr:hypothetical protein IWQ60_012014 [Tieghemiomyces parasiticus]